MKGRIVSFRRGIKTQYKTQMLVRVPEVESRAKASNLQGRTVVWKTASGKEIFGKITQPHGNSGVVKVKFRRGLPGQSVGTEVEIKE
ncbi:MAG: 50S ribosomal protein L35ae [Candidatus Nanoarchaeia archaeon]|nr:50S ribosomal protein L35ae [Candidatus Nanoarchaeia archaeon]